MTTHNNYPGQAKKHEHRKTVPVLVAEVDRDDEHLTGLETTIMDGIRKVEQLLDGKLVTEENELQGVRLISQKGEDQVGGLDISLDVITASVINDSSKTVTISDRSVRVELSHGEDRNHASESFGMQISRSNGDGGWEPVHGVSIEANGYSRIGRLKSQQFDQEAPVPVHDLPVKEVPLDGKLLAEVQQAVGVSQQLLAELPQAA